MKITYLLTATAAFGLASATPVQAGLVDYTFPSGSFSPTSTDPNVTAGNVNLGGGVGELSPGVSLPDAIFYRVALNTTTPAQAVANNEYFQFILTPNAGYELDLSSLTFDATRGGTPEPRGFVLRTSLDGFGADVATGTIPTVTTNLSPFNIDLSGPGFQNINSAVTFRLYQFAPSPTQANLYDNLIVNGSATLSAVPEPGTALFGLALLGVTGIRRRRI